MFAEAWQLCFVNPLVFQVATATLRGYCRQEVDGHDPRTRMSGFVIAEALLHLYKKQKLLPEGLTPENPLAQKWAVKVGVACRKLVPGLC